MFRPFFGDDYVARGRKLARLSRFLKRAFEVRHVRRSPVTSGQRRFDNPGLNERTRRVQTTVEIEGGNERFDGVRKQGFLGSAAAHLFPAAQIEELAQSEML